MGTYSSDRGCSKLYAKLGLPRTQPAAAMHLSFKTISLYIHALHTKLQNTYYKLFIALNLSHLQAEY